MPLADTVAVQDVMGAVADQIGLVPQEGPAELARRSPAQARATAAASSAAGSRGRRRSCRQATNPSGRTSTAPAGPSR